MQGVQPGGNVQTWTERVRRFATGAIPHTQIPVWVVALFCVGVGGGLLLPVGPDASGSQIESSFRTAVNDDEGPPSNDGDGIKSLDCSRKLIVSNSNWTCKLEREIALFPDASGVYEVAVEADGCWTATLNEAESDNEAQVIGTDFDGCIR